MTKHTKKFIILLIAVLLTACAAVFFRLRTHLSTQPQPSGLAQTPAPDPASLHIESYLRASDVELDLSAADFVPKSEDEIALNPCQDLSVPTYVTKVDDIYFIVDCYHNQVIYSDNLESPLGSFHVMTDEISLGHTLASDGLVYLVDDTENNRILIFEKQDGIFYHTQTFSDVGNRPHYIIYNEADATFYVWSSMNGEMYLMRHNPQDSRMYLTEIRTVSELADTYVRSFTILGDQIFFVSGIPGEAAIRQADLDTFRIHTTYPVPDSMAGMIQLTRIQDYYYITVSTDKNGSQDSATLIRVKDLADLSKGRYEDIYASFVGGGTPYYITRIDDRYYLTEHRLPGHSIWSFRVTDNELCDVKSLY